MGADTPVDITQSLGGAYTVCTPRGLFRIDARDADALGFAVPDEAKLREFGEPVTEPEVWDALRQVYDPEIPVNIYDLGLIYETEIADNGDVAITMTPSDKGRLEVFLDGDKIFDRKEAGAFPDLSKVNELKMAIAEKLFDLEDA